MLAAAAAAMSPQVIPGVGPQGAPSNVSVYFYAGSLVGVQWANGDVEASTQLARTGGAEPTSADATVGPGQTQYETGGTEEFFWWARHYRNGQAGSWVLATAPDTEEDIDPDDPLRPVIDSVIQLTPADECLVGCSGCVSIRVNLTMVGSSLGTLQERVDGGSWSTVDPGVAAGATRATLSGRDPSKLYEYRIRYNDVSPDTWSTVRGVTTECTLI